MDKIGILLIVLTFITTLTLSIAFTEGIISTTLLILFVALYFGVIKLIFYISKE